MADEKLTKMKAAMAGATQGMKAQLKEQVDAATFEDIKTTARTILNRLPGDKPLGTLTAALMLAATAYAEGASHAGRLLDDAADQSKSP